MRGSDGRGNLGAVVIGVLAGWIAERLKNRHRILTNLIVGVVGAYIGGWLAYAVGWANFGVWAGLVVSVVGATVLLFLLGLIRKS